MILPIIVAKLATLSLAALIYTLLAHNLSALPSPGISTPLTTDEVIMLLRNDFEIETWACGLAVPGAHGLWEQRCMIEKVGRWMLVPQSVMGFLALVVVVAGLGVEKRVMEREGEGKLG